MKLFGLRALLPSALVLSEIVQTAMATWWCAYEHSYVAVCMQMPPKNPSYVEHLGGDTRPGPRSSV
jgi:hypothetical protein